MTNDSRTIAARFFELGQFCRDVALLLRTSDDVFKREGWQQGHANNRSIYSGSGSLDWPEYWLPLRFFRSYRNAMFDRYLAYLAVVIDLPNRQELEHGIALLTAGALRYDTVGRAQTPLTTEGTNLFLWHTLRADRSDDGRPTWHAPPFRWQDNRIWRGWQEACIGIEAAVTLALPLHEVVSATELESKVIAPIIQALLRSNDDRYGTALSSS